MNKPAKKFTQEKKEATLTFDKHPEIQSPILQVLCMKLNSARYSGKCFLHIGYDCSGYSASIAASSR